MWNILSFKQKSKEEKKLPIHTCKKCGRGYTDKDFSLLCEEFDWINGAFRGIK